MLWTCLHFSDFSLQLLLRGAAQPQPTIITTGGNRPAVLSCNPEARSQGIAPGMAVATALALSPDLIERPRDVEAELKAFEGAAAWASQFTSLVSLAATDSLLLEIDGSLRLFGGLRPLLQRFGQELADMGYAATIAVAPTPTAARLLARSGIGSTITDVANLETALAGLPLSLLDQSEDIIRMLALMGVSTIGECLALPRDGLARRFGQFLVDELDRALGRLPDPRPIWIAPPRYKARLLLPAPVQDTEPLLFATSRLIQELTGWLSMRQAGITRLKLVLHHEDRRPTSIALGFATPSREPQRIRTLLRERLSTLTLPDRVESIGLESVETRPLGSRNLSLFPEDRLPEEERWLIIDHLRARLGAEAVYSIVSHPDHRPELAWRCCEPGASTPGDEHAARPLWLLDPPQLLRTGADDKPVLKEPLVVLSGPERIESGWWDEKEAKRDYFVAADSNGRRFWVYRERAGAKTWFLQGMFT
jgi:protein ImuB